MNSVSNQPAPERRLLNERDAAIYCGCSVPWLRALRASGSRTRVTAPAHIKIGRAVRYDLRDLDLWISTHRVCR